MGNNPASPLLRRLLDLFWPPDDRLRLREMLELRGARLPERSSESEARYAAQAARRCLFCNAKTLCDAYLQAGDPNAYRGFCPNAAYVALQRDKTRTLT